MRNNLGGAAIGLLFGVVLSWAQVTDPRVIQAMLLLKEPDVFLLMGSAIAVSSAGIWLLRLRGVRAVSSGEPITWERTTPQGRHVLGSAMFGLGWALTQSCPGPVAAMMGQGKLGGITVGAGIFVGVWTFRSYELRRAHLSQRIAEACVTA